MIEDRKPDFMGVWTQPSGKKEYFFMFNSSEVDLPAICGDVHDPLGKSSSGGEIYPDRVSFTKMYDNLGGSRASGPIQYMGSKVDDHYEGEFVFIRENGEEYKGTFVLEEYVPSETLDAVVAALVKENELHRK